MSNPHLVDPTAVRKFVVQAIMDGKTRNLAKQLQDHFGVSRPTAHNYLSQLVAAEIVERTGPGRYTLRKQQHHIAHSLKGLDEYEVWINEIKPLLQDLPPNVVDIWRYGCTEMINNAVDHSESPGVLVTVTRTASTVDVTVLDRGVGIFRKIARALGLEDDRHAALELTKGKVTTDPARHTGEGIFFSSRAFDSFRILSGDVYFDHEGGDDRDWILGEEKPREKVEGTSVFMTLSTTSPRILQDVFDAYATDTEKYGFDRTVVPVKLLQYGDDHLVSRSQAKRLLSRFDRFKTVVLNFEGVETIGQAFADEVLRVFPSQHPEVELVPMNANEQVSRMITRATAGRVPQRDLFSGAIIGAPIGSGPIASGGIGGEIISGDADDSDPT